MCERASQCASGLPQRIRALDAARIYHALVIPAFREHPTSARAQSRFLPVRVACVATRAELEVGETALRRYPCTSRSPAGHFARADAAAERSDHLATESLGLRKGLRGTRRDRRRAIGGWTFAGHLFVFVGRRRDWLPDLVLRIAAGL